MFNITETTVFVALKNKLSSAAEATRVASCGEESLLMVAILMCYCILWCKCSLQYCELMLFVESDVECCCDISAECTV